MKNLEQIMLCQQDSVLLGVCSEADNDTFGKMVFKLQPQYRCRFHRYLQLSFYAPLYHSLHFALEQKLDKLPHSLDLALVVLFLS